MPPNLLAKIVEFHLAKAVADSLGVGLDVGLMIDPNQYSYY